MAASPSCTSCDGVQKSGQRRQQRWWRRVRAAFTYAVRPEVMSVGARGGEPSELSESGQSGGAAAPVTRLVVFVQENHTIDNYFRGLAPYGARVASRWPLSPNPPESDQPHDRRAYFHWLTTGRAVRRQFDTRAVLPYYLYLATTGAFFENHCSQFGGPSTPNHLVLIGGQSPTLRNPAAGHVTALGHAVRLRARRSARRRLARVHRH